MIVGEIWRDQINNMSQRTIANISPEEEERVKRDTTVVEDQVLRQMTRDLYEAHGFRFVAEDRPWGLKYFSENTLDLIRQQWNNYMCVSRKGSIEIDLNLWVPISSFF
eukprot:52014_1